MQFVTAHLRGVSNMSHSRQHRIEMKEKESHDAYEKRTWLEKLHYDEKTGEAFVPPMALKMALAEAAKFRGEQIPGKGKATYTKHFEAGVLCMDPMMLGINKADIKGEWINANSDGVRGSGKRVQRCFPCIPSGWTGAAKFIILDDTITADVFERVLKEAGQFIGLGRFRPRNGGFYGRFVVDRIEFAEAEKMAEAA